MSCTLQLLWGLQASKIAENSKFTNQSRQKKKGYEFDLSVSSLSYLETITCFLKYSEENLFPLPLSDRYEKNIKTSYSEPNINNFRNLNIQR